MTDTDKSLILTEGQIKVPKHLPDKYFRECANEDGCMTRYKLVTDVPSYREGYKAGRDASDAYKDAYWQDRIAEAVREERESVLGIVKWVAEYREKDGFGSQGGWLSTIHEALNGDLFVKPGQALENKDGKDG